MTGVCFRPLSVRARVFLGRVQEWARLLEYRLYHPVLSDGARPLSPPTWAEGEINGNKGGLMLLRVSAAVAD